jgi:hypothetical protein
MPLPLLQNRLRQAVKVSGSPLQVIEKDYAMSYLLAGNNIPPSPPA